MDRALVAALRARGVDVQTALEARMIEIDDADHLAYSTSQDRVLLTKNQVREPCPTCDGCFGD